MTSRAALHLLRQRQCVCLLTRHNALALASPAWATPFHIVPAPTTVLLPSTRFKSTTQNTATPESTGKKSQAKTSSAKKKGVKAKQEIESKEGSGIPKGLSSLIVPNRNEIGSFPVAHKVSELIRRFHHGDSIQFMNTASLEGILISHFSAGKMKRMPNKLAAFNSKKASQEWEKGKTLAALQMLGEVIKEILTNGDTANTLHRVCYLMAILRLGCIIEDVVGRSRADELRSLEELCARCAEEHGFHAPAFYYWISLVKSNADVNQERAHRLASKYPELLKHLDMEMFTYARGYSKMEEKPSTVIYKGMPDVFVLGNVEIFANKLMETLERYRLDEVTLSKIVAYKSLALWNAGKAFNYTRHGSKSLASLAAAMETWMKTLHDEVSRKELGSAVLLCFSDMLRESSGEKVDLSPAHDFLDIVCDKLSKTYDNNLVPYIYWVLLGCGEGGAERAAKILSRYPGVEQLRDERVETHLTKNSSVSAKLHFFGEYLANIDVDAIQARTDIIVGESNSAPQETVSASVGSERIGMSEETKQELLDIRVLEMLQSGAPAEEIIVALDNGSGIYPTDDVLIAVAKKFISSENGVGLQDLKHSVPLKSRAADWIYDQESNARLKSNHRERWMNGKKLAAVAEVLSVYEGILEEEYHLSSSALISITTTAKNYLGWVSMAHCVQGLHKNLLMEGRMLARKPHFIQRLYLEETLLASELKDDSGMSKEVLRLVEQRGRIVAETHGDLTVLASCWETMFFSTRFELQQRAAAFLKENVKIVHSLDPDHLLGRAHRSRNESNFRRLIEIALTHDLDDYEKTRFFEGLLVFQCEAGNAVSATSTVDYAKKAGISIGADAMTMYLTLMKEDASKMSLWARLLARVKK